MSQYQNYPMVLNNVYLGMIGLRTDQMNYFDIPKASDAEWKAAQYKTSGTDIFRSRFPNQLDSTAKSGTDIKVKRTARTKNHSKDNLMRGGRKVIIPTEMRSVPPTANSTDPNNTTIKKGNIRTTVIKFPGAADMAEISAWVHLKLVSKKPKYIKLPGGRNYPVVAFTSGQVTGAEETTA